MLSDLPENFTYRALLDHMATFLTTRPPGAALCSPHDGNLRAILIAEKERS